MKKLMNFFMLSCKKASELIDKKSVVDLSMRENIQLRMHTSMCDACTAYQKQSKVLDTFLQNHVHGSDESKVQLIENSQLKNKIISKLNQS